MKQDHCTPPGNRRFVRLFTGLFIAGFLLGMAFCIRFRNHILPLMRGLPYASVSIVLFPAVLLLPFLLSWVLCCLHPAFLFPVCFCRAFGFAFVHLGLSAAFPGCGWLMRWLFLFSDCACLPLLFVFWLRLVRRGDCRRIRELSAPCAIAGIIGAVDRFLILPFAAELLFLQKG